MPSNIEIKARVADMAALRARAETVADGPAEVIPQEDIFFACPTGRLKLRVFADGAGQLISYARVDTPDAKRSDYRIHRTDDPVGLRAVLADALGETMVVRKVRHLLLAGQTRIHLDEVEGLGSFMELEVVMREGQPDEEGRAIAARLMEQLGIGEGDLIPCAYADLLARGPRL
jgi:predicted adenylyl cyclase CyaB